MKNLYDLQDLYSSVDVSPFTWLDKVCLKFCDCTCVPGGVCVILSLSYETVCMMCRVYAMYMLQLVCLEYMYAPYDFE